MEFPNLLKTIMDEAPTVYAVIAAMDYRDKRKTEKELFVEWNRHKVKYGIFPQYHISSCRVHNEPALPKGRCNCGLEDG